MNLPLRATPREMLCSIPGRRTFGPAEDSLEAELPDQCLDIRGIDKQVFFGSGEGLPEDVQIMIIFADFFGNFSSQGMRKSKLCHHMMTS